MSRLPQPLSVTGQVTFDPVTRSLFAKPAEAGLGSLIWRQGHEAMMQADGSLGSPPPVFARVAGKGEIGRHGEPVRREVDPPIQVEMATWSPGGQLDWWVKERRAWFGRVRGKDGKQRWIKASDLRPADSG